MKVNKKEITKIILMLKTSYPYAFKDMKNDEIESMVGLYELHFKDYPYETLEKAIFNITSTEEYMPSIARIKREVANLAVPKIPRAEEEWNKVIDLVHKYGSYKQEKAYSEMNDYTRYITQCVGYMRICNSTAEEQTWNKKEFIEEYNALKDKNIEMYQLGDMSYAKNLIETEIIE